ncbi:hypothetical protein HPP92_018547 [Vanilla planifolia]|uniref:Uncharacterized protein n=1 Tax=Vanilla planifolia TaxID=51239 RepID=A0A835QBB6_VANPL|nr:hypothetical protein HPP92_018547 [Vanilla planifolia]
MLSKSSDIFCFLPEVHALLIHCTLMEFPFGNELFRNGFNVMVVDEDVASLKTMQAMLSSCHYKVTATNCPASALSILREEGTEINLLVINVEMKAMSSIEFLHTISKEFSIPFILMSSDSSSEAMIQGIKMGACYFFEKPLEIDIAKSIWKHTVIKKISQSEGSKLPSLEKKDNQDKVFVVAEESGIVHHNTDKICSGQSVSFEEEDEEQGHEPAFDKGKRKRYEERYDDLVGSKKRRLIWTDELEKKFAEAVEFLGKAAIPSRIMKLMNVKGLQRNHVASHLQKYRLRKEREQDSITKPLLQFLNSRVNFLSGFSETSNLGQNPQATKSQSSFSSPLPGVTSYPLFNVVHVQHCLRKLGYDMDLTTDGSVSFSTVPFFCERKEGGREGILSNNTQMAAFEEAHLVPQVRTGEVCDLGCYMQMLVGEEQNGDGFAGNCSTIDLASVAIWPMEDNGDGWDPYEKLAVGFHVQDMNNDHILQMHCVDSSISVINAEELQKESTAGLELAW